MIWCSGWIFFLFGEILPPPTRNHGFVYENF